MGVTTPIPSPKPGAATESIRLGVGLTLVLVAAYFGFIGLSAFAPVMLARPVMTGGTVTWAFAYAFGVIGLGVALTGIYVLAANRAETRRSLAR
ncbi:DUF485 domain-containing protein [Methylobacterium sp. WL6]|jgi:uncharacterized membrane protein (DUF485 family)|nr:DUF485 domain-containing protein [Methylobacterium sp. WL6]